MTTGEQIITLDVDSQETVSSFHPLKSPNFPDSPLLKTTMYYFSN